MLGSEQAEQVISPDTFLAVNVAFCNCFRWIWGVLYAACAPRAPHFYPPSTPCMFFRNALSTPSWIVFNCVQKKGLRHLSFFLCCLIKWEQRWGFPLFFFFCKRATVINRESGEKKKMVLVVSAHCFSMKENHNKWYQTCSVVTEMLCFFPFNCDHSN